MPKVHVPCGHCHGSGQIELTGAALETLNQLVLCGREVSGAELGRMMDVSNESMCNRLVSLESYGLVTSRRHGPARLWSVNKKGASK